MNAILRFRHLPKIRRGYLIVSLSDRLSEAATNPLMTGIANALEETIIADVAPYYAGHPKRNPNPATLGELPRPSCARGRFGNP
jgi:cytochrome c553